MARIASYVFLDLETTSLPHLEANKTKITELSMVVVKRKHILDTKAGVLPRVQHKLTMCFNPGRMISPEATDASGLDNELLEYETMFNMEVFNTINSFLNCQEKPVCLIAENGLNFDFPILKNHFVKLNVSLNEDIMCADSLHAFYDIFKKQLSCKNGILYDQDNKANSTSCESTALECNETTNNFNSSEPNAVPFKNNYEEIIPLAQSENVDELLINDTVNKEINTQLSMQNRNEKTPSALKYNNEEITPSAQTENEDELLINGTEDEGVSTQLSMQSRNERTPSAKKIRITPVKTLKGVKRRIFFEGDSKPKESYKLMKIYERVLGSPQIEAHRAENDCIMAAELSTSKVEKFIDWIDNNHCAFSEVKPMTIGVRLGD